MFSQLPWLGVPLQATFEIEVASTGLRASELGVFWTIAGVAPRAYGHVAPVAEVTRPL